MNKEEKYRQIAADIAAILEGCDDEISIMSTISAVLHAEMDFWWTGFYRVVGGRLIVGPFQGPVACLQIAYGKGVCGTAWKEGRTVIVPDVHQFPGHIACSELSRSEIVIPIARNGEIISVLDIDSKELATFDETDARWLEQIVGILSNPELHR